MTEHRNTQFSSIMNSSESASSTHSLLKERGNINPYYVSPEIRSKTEKESAMLAKRKQSHLRKQAISVKNKIEDKISRFEQARADSIHDWQQRTINSPLAQQQFTLYQRNEDIINNIKRENRRIAKIESHIDHMTGKPKIDIIHPSDIHTMAAGVEHNALCYRRLKLENTVLSREARVLKRMTENELNLAKQFLSNKNSRHTSLDLK